MTSPRLTTLGHLRLTHADVELLTGRRKLLLLLAYVARRSKRGVRRDQLAALLWGERNEGRAKQSLRQALLELRSALGDALEVTADNVALANDALTLDIADFEAAVTAGRYEEAIDLWQGEFLPGADEETSENLRVWIEEERASLTQRLLWSLKQLVESAEMRGDWDAVARWAERWTAVAPYDEAAHTHVVRSLFRAGHEAEAFARHRAFAVHLRQTMESEPSQAFTELLADLQRAVPAQRPRMPSIALRRPKFVGRDAALAALRDAWRRAPEHGALIAVEGVAGSGKSRLYAEFLHELPEKAPRVLLEADAAESESGLAHAVTRKLLAPLRTAPGVSGAADASLAELAELVPALRERYRNLPTPRRTEQALAAAVRDVVAAVAAEAPVIIFVDNIELADAQTHRVLRDLSGLANVLVLLTFSPHESMLHGEAAELLKAPSIARIKLNPLDTAATRMLLASMLDLPEEDLNALATSLHAEARGNPFFVIESVTALADQAVLIPAIDGGWRLNGARQQRFTVPATVRALVHHQLETLPQPAREMLDAAALVESATARKLAHVAGMSREASVAGLAILLARRLLIESGDNEYAVANPLIRRAISDQLAESRRRAYAARARASERPHRKWYAAATTVVVVLAIVGGFFIAHKRNADIDRNTLLVLPFSVRGSTQVGYLSEGLIDLLRARLDGAAGIHVVDPNALLGFLGKHDATPITLDDARKAASHFGAGMFVLGKVVASPRAFEASASVYDVSGKLRTTVNTTVADESRVFDAVDELARQLLVAIYGGSAGALIRLAGEAPALPAMRSYLEGEAAMRAGRNRAALDAFGTAVQADSSFALAYYRLAVAANWTTDYVIADSAAARAAAYGTRLPPTVRTLLAAFLAWRRGDAPQAETLYREATMVDRTNVEAWFGLGDIMYHHNPVRGRSKAAARAALEKVLTLDPNNGEALLHLLELAAWEGRVAEVDSLLSRLGSNSDFAQKWPLVRALLRKDDADAKNQIALIQKEDDRTLVRLIVHAASAFPTNPVGGEKLVALLTEPERDAGWRAYGYSLLALLAMEQGQWSRARTALHEVEQIDSVAAVENEALWAAAPGVPMSNAGLDSLRVRIRAWNPAAFSTGANRLFAVHDSVQRSLRYYLLGLLAARAGDIADAEACAQSLDAIQARHERPLATTLARSVRAHALLRQGKAEAALEALGEPRVDATSHKVSYSPIYGQTYERYLRAELLAAVGREKEAIEQFASAADYSVSGLAYLAPSFARRATIYRHERNPAQSELFASRFAQIMVAADPNVRTAATSSLVRAFPGH